MLKQKSVLEVTIENKTYSLICESDSPLGSLHDALMQMKGWTVDRMIAAQKEEQKIAEDNKKENCCQE